MDKDKIEIIENSTVQHGKLNNRIYLMKYNSDTPILLIKKIIELAKKKGYTKIFCKIPVTVEKVFNEYGFLTEAFIPKFYNNKIDVKFMSLFLNNKRKKNYDKETVEQVLKVCKTKSEFKNIGINSEYNVIEIKPELSESLSELYKVVFASYPFPIFKPDYIEYTMKNNVRYFGIIHKPTKKLIAASSAEMDIENQNAEMTDFACLPEFRGNNFAILLLQEMEKRIIENNIKTYYTIARAVSYGMNITFKKAGYKFTGTLINNTNISGNIESMNVWYK